MFMNLMPNVNFYNLMLLNSIQKAKLKKKSLNKGKFVQTVIPAITQNEWSTISIAVKSDPLQDLRILTTYLDGQFGGKYELEIPILTPEMPLKLFNCSYGVKTGATPEICDVRFVCVDTEFLSGDRILELHVPMGVWRCACKQFNGPAHDHCLKCFAEKLKSGISNHF
jgi:hypothetical protein